MRLRWTIVLWSAAIAAAGAPKGSGIRFDGATAYAVSNAALGLKADGFSVAAWVRTPDPAKTQILMTMGESGAEFTVYLYDRAVRMLVEHRPGSYAYARADAPEPDTWTHYVGTYDGRAVRMYHNGQLADETAAPWARAGFASHLILGSAETRAERALRGAMEAARVWNRVLSAEEVRAVFSGPPNGSAAEGLIGRWTSRGATDNGLPSAAPGGPDAIRFQPGAPALLNQKGEGFRGIWYYNQRLTNQYVYKYSGGLGTYCANHSPFAWYAPEATKTFFCYGGTDASNRTLWHMVSYYDHATRRVARPTLLLDKRTDDAHDNPVLNLDDRGHIWIFPAVTAGGAPRASREASGRTTSATFKCSGLAISPIPSRCIIRAAAFSSSIRGTSLAAATT